MTARAAHLIHEALQLSPEERADMAAELLASLDEPASGTDWVKARARIVQSAL